jgi:hypothetical protein
MDQKSYQFVGMLLISIGQASGCASTNRGIIATDDVSRDAVVEMVVHNRTQEVMRVDLNWESLGGGGSPRSQRRLGDLPAGGTGTFSVPNRWRGISLTVRLLRGETANLFPSVAVDGVQRGPVVEIGPGDRLEWSILGVGNLFSVQLIAHDRDRRDQSRIARRAPTAERFHQ